MVAGISPGGITYIVGSVVLCILATLAVTLRIIARKIRSQSIGADDYTVIAALVLYYAMMIQVVLWAVIGKIGFPTSSLTRNQLGFFLQAGEISISLSTSDARADGMHQIFFANQVNYSCICPVVKTSILLLYRRIFVYRSFRIVSLLVGVLVTSWGIAVLSVSIFQCTPVDKFWNPSLHGHCVDAQTFFWVFVLMY